MEYALQDCMENDKTNSEAEYTGPGKGRNAHFREPSFHY